MPLYISIAIFYKKFFLGGGGLECLGEKPPPIDGPLHDIAISYSIHALSVMHMVSRGPLCSTNCIHAYIYFPHQ